jgi:predicted nucleic acid-binding protein
VIVEARAALAAAQRAKRITVQEHRLAKSELAALLDEITFVEITEDLASAAGDVAEAEELRGYDAMHLAVALAVGATVFTSADAALCEAAHRRGLHVANPIDR